jgi:hypothetical protein
MEATLLPKAVGNVASVATILAMPIAVCREFRTTGRTGKVIDCFSLNAVKVAIPPGDTASVRAELPGLLLWHYFDGLATLLAAHDILSDFTIKSISAAKGTNGII